MPFVRFFLHLLFGGAFVYAGYQKALDPALFVMDVRSFNVLPDPYAAWVAMGLPWLEILAGLAVITGILRRGGLLVLNASLLVFLIAIGQAWYRGIDIQCGCFGSDHATGNYMELIVRDLVLLLLGGYLWMTQARTKKAAA